MKTCIVIPMKSPERSKQRLAKVLSRNQRRNLAIYLFEQNVKFFKDTYPEHDLLVVTESTRIKSIAESLGAEVLLEDKLAGLNAAVSAATEFNVQRNFDSQLIVPGDIEKLDCHELDCLLSYPRSKRSVIVCPSYDGGTNALLTSPPDAIPFSYGPNSSQVHLLTAFELGLQTKRLYLERLSFDVDRPEDLQKIDITFDKKTA